MLAGGSATAKNGGGAMTPLRNGSNGASSAELVRKKLQQISAGGDASAVWRLWVEIVRIVVDTVKMAGSGLV